MSWQPEANQLSSVIRAVIPDRNARSRGPKELKVDVGDGVLIEAVDGGSEPLPFIT